MDSLVAVEESLDSLEEVLGPLLEHDLSQTLSKLDLLQKAKLQVLLPYVVNALVFMYLRTRGINPRTHPVVGELDRIKQYFDKINAEDPATRRFAVDQGAATRFIRHAIKESQAAQNQAQRELRKGTYTQPAGANVVQGSSASAAALAKIQARASENDEQESSSEESDLQVISDSSKPENIIAESTKGKGKETPPNKKRRRGMDPWAGSPG